jgi:hypothetical protein
MFTVEAVEVGVKTGQKLEWQEVEGRNWQLSARELRRRTGSRWVVACLLCGCWWSKTLVGEWDEQQR